MKTLLYSASLAVAAILPSVAQAQAIPPAIVAIVDLQKVTVDCNACKAANATLNAQVSSLRTRQQTLAGPLQTEQKTIQDQIDALKGKEPDAALKARAQAWQTKAQQAQQDITRQEQQIDANAQYVKRQIAEKLAPIYSQVMTRRGANILVEQGATLASGATLDVTNDVLAALNTALPTVSTTAPAQPQPQGR